MYFRPTGVSALMKEKVRQENARSSRFGAALKAEKDLRWSIL